MDELFNVILDETSGYPIAYEIRASIMDELWLYISN